MTLSPDTEQSRKSPDRPEDRGYTLLEIMLVVGLISIIMVMAIPNMQHARRNALETGAVQSLKQLAQAEELYYDAFGYYTAGHDQWHDLRRCDAIDSKAWNRLSGRRGHFIKGYSVQMINLGEYPQSYSIFAWPIERGIDMKTFFIMGDGIVRDTSEFEAVAIY